MQKIRILCAPEKNQWEVEVLEWITALEFTMQQ